MDIIEFIVNFGNFPDYSVTENKNKNRYGAELHKVEHNCIHFSQLRNIIESDKELKKFSDEFKEAKLKFIKEQYEKGLINSFKYYRLKKNITQKKMAQILNTPQPNISRLEKMKNLNNIPLIKAKEISLAFNISIEELLTP